MTYSPIFFFFSYVVLNADEASLIALEFDMNPIVDSEAALDLYPR